MVIVYSIAGGKPDAYRVAQVKRQNADFVVTSELSHHAYGANQLVSRYPETGEVRLTALRHFIENSVEGDLMLMVDDDDFIEVDRSLCSNVSLKTQGPVVDALWCWLISKTAARDMLEHFSEGQLRVKEAEDCLLLASLYANDYKEGNFVKVERGDYNVERDNRRFNVENYKAFVKSFPLANLHGLKQIFKQYTIIPLLSTIPHMVSHLDLTDYELIAYLRMYSVVACEPAMEQSELRDFILDVIRKTDIAMLVPYKSETRMVRVTRPITHKVSTHDVAIVKLFSASYEDFVPWSKLNDFLFRLRNPNSANIKIFYVYNGKNPPEWCDWDFTFDLSLSGVREAILDAMEDCCDNDPYIAWLDGDDQIDIEVINRLVDNGEQLINACCMTTPGNHCTSLSNGVMTAHSTWWDGLNTHWVALLKRSSFLRIQRAVRQEIHEKSADMPFAHEDGCFYNEDILHSRYRQSVRMYDNTPVVYRFSGGSSNSLTKMTYDRWFELYAVGLWVAAKSGRIDEVQWYFKGRIDRNSFSPADQDKINLYQRALHEAVPQFEPQPLAEKSNVYCPRFTIPLWEGIALGEDAALYDWAW